MVSSQFLPSRTGYKSYARTCVAEERSILFSLEKLSVPQIAPGLVSLVMIDQMSGDDMVMTEVYEFHSWFVK